MKPLELMDRERAACAASGRREALLASQCVALAVAQSLPEDVELACWSLYPGVAEAHVLGSVDDDDLDRSRRIFEIATSSPGFVYRADRRDLYTTIAAVREVDGVTVRLWDHIGRHYEKTAASGVAA